MGLHPVFIGYTTRELQRHGERHIHREPGTPGRRRIVCDNVPVYTVNFGVKSGPVQAKDEARRVRVSSEKGHIWASYV